MLRTALLRFLRGEATHGAWLQELRLLTGSFGNKCSMFLKGLAIGCIFCGARQRPVPKQRSYSHPTVILRERPLRGPHGTGLRAGGWVGATPPGRPRRLPHHLRRQTVKNTGGALHAASLTGSRSSCRGSLRVSLTEAPSTNGRSVMCTVGVVQCGIQHSAIPQYSAVQYCTPLYIRYPVYAAWYVSLPYTSLPAQRDAFWCARRPPQQLGLVVQARQAERAHDAKTLLCCAACTVLRCAVLCCAV